MSIDASSLAAIIGMALATYLTRVAGLWLVRFVKVTGRTKAALDALPPAILMAVIAPTVLATGVPETAAAGVTALASLRLPLLAAVAVGVATVVGLRLLLS